MSPILLALALVALLVLLQAGLWWLARALGRRLWNAAMVAGLVLPLALLAPWRAPDRVLAPTATLHIPGAPEAEDKGPHRELNDAVLQFIPWELDLRHALAAGRLPFWSDLVDGGSSPWANPQAGPLSPLAMLSRALPIQYFLLAVLAFKMMVALEGAALLARACGARSRWALLAGIAFALGGGIQAWGLFPHTRAAAWIPWLVVGALTCVRRRRPRAVVATALAMAAMLLEGHPETALAGGLFAAVVAFALVPRCRPWRGGVIRAASAALLGLALATPHVLPFLAALPDSSRAAETLGDLDRSAEMRWDDPSSWFFQRRGALLLAPLARDVFGFPYSSPQSGGAISWPDSLTAYAGVVCLAGAFAAFLSRHRRVALVFGTVALVSLVLAAEPLPLMRLLFELPPLRAPAYARLLLVASLALSIAGAVGLQALASGRRRVWWGCVVAAGLALSVAPNAANVALWLVVLALALVLVRGRAAWQPRLAVLWLVLVLVDLFPWARATLPVGPPAIFYPRTAALARVADEVAVDGPWRVVGEDFLFYPNLPSVYGLADPRAHNPMAPAAQLRAMGAAFDFAPLRERYFAPLHRPEHPFLDFLNVRIVLSSRYRPALVGFERLPEEFDPFVLWRNPDALPRWFLASGADEVTAKALPGWIAGMTDARRVSLAPGTLARLGCPAVVAGVGSVETIRARPGRIELRVPAETPACALVATSIPYARGWHARGNGKALTTLHLHGGYLGIAPAGARDFELLYTPPGLWLGGALCLLAALSLAWMFVRGSARRKEEPR